MLNTDLQAMIDEVKDGRMDRRAFVQRMFAFGLTAPMATQILAIGGVALAERARHCTSRPNVAEAVR